MKSPALLFLHRICAHMACWRGGLVGVLLLALLVGQGPRAQATGQPPLQIEQQPDGVRLALRSSVPQSAAAAAQAWPLVEIDGVRVPARLVTLQLDREGPVVPQLRQLTSGAWAGTLQPAQLPSQRAPTGELLQPLAQPPAAAPPSQPVVVLRDGRLRGLRIVVLAVCAVFQQDGALRSPTALDLLVPGAQLLDPQAAALLDRSGPFIAAAPGPSNPLARRSAARVLVTQPGMQRVRGADLAAAGLSLGNGALLHVYYQGRQVPAQVPARALGPDDELWFYAGPPGDRWNAADSYWISVEATPGLRIALRHVAPHGTTPARLTAFERGVWRANRLYDAALPGPDRDHWYAIYMASEPASSGSSAPAPSITLLLTPTLPLVQASTTFTVTGSVVAGSQHRLQLSAGSVAQTTSWSASGDWARPMTLAANQPRLTLTQLPASGISGIEIDSVAWQRPVMLQLAGRGAAFTGVPGTWRYQLSGVPAGAQLYDISDPRAPLLLGSSLRSGTSLSFQDGPTPRSYLLTGAGTLITPTVIAHTPVDLAAPRNADTLYIATAAFRQVLAPLIARRQAQGYRVQLIDAQAIYDSWSYGQVAPEAIRAFLRYAASSWQRVPASVTLVGDGSIDPHNYSNSNRDGSFNNVTILPPYPAMVDPWLGETACESCYAQLDGASPLDDPLPDLALGRLPAKTPAELAALVDKLIAYETAPLALDWRARVAYVADNGYEPDGQPDPAGDFAHFSDRSAALQPSGTQIAGVYYDPWGRAASAPATRSLRERDPVAAHSRTLATFNAGAGLLNYTGHSSQYQWAATNEPAAPDQRYLLGLYDADLLTNRDRLPIVLEMTCLTSAFQTPAFSGTSIDERLLLNPAGGAAATWGSTGFGVTYGHDQLQEGFYRALWASPPLRSQLSTLTLASYLQLYTQGGCCQDALRTFVLLGDPRMPARVLPVQRVFLPVARG